MKNIEVNQNLSSPYLFQDNGGGFCVRLDTLMETSNVYLVKLSGICGSVRFKVSPASSDKLATLKF